MKYLKKFEGFEIKSIPFEETQFKELIKKLAPNNFSKYYTLFKNKGLDIAKEKLLKDHENDYLVSKEVEKIRRYEDRVRKNIFHIATDDINFYTPTQKDTKQYISDGIFKHGRVAEW